MEKPVIRLVDYALAFPIFHGGARSLKKSLFKSVKQTVASRGRVGGQVRNVSDTMMVQALDGLTLEINAGERVGLIGHNGAGKSTLLRALAGIYESPSGKLEIRGEVHALLDPQSGMNIDLTGRENIELFARMLQFDQNQTKELEREVEDFADLGAFWIFPCGFIPRAWSCASALASRQRPGRKFCSWMNGSWRATSIFRTKRARGWKA